MNAMQKLWGLLTGLLLLGLVVYSDGAAQGARAGLATCTALIVPALLPFFVVSLLMNELGLTHLPERLLAGPMGLFFGVSGQGGAVFFQSILGGYPLGAGVIGDLVRRGELSAKEGAKLLPFCNNCGPAFLLGAVGVGVFRSAALGAILYVCHVLGALLTGLFLSGTKNPAPAEPGPFVAALSLPSALPRAMKTATAQLLGICGYIVFFSAVAGMLEELGAFSGLYGSLAASTGLSLQVTRSLCMGLLELGSGIGAMAGLAPTAGNLSLAAFITGFGGLSVAMQTAGVLEGTGIPLWRHLAGRLCTACISAFLVYTWATALGG